MALQVYSFTQIVSNFATAVQGSASALLNFTVGSVLRAIAQATAGVVLWLQAIILQLLTLTRAATSSGADLDSFYADYGFARLAGNASTGLVTLARFTPTQQALVPIGRTVQSQDGTQNFTITIDTTNTAYNATLSGYVIPVNTASVTVPVQNNVAGSAGNVLAGAITVITTPIQGVDTATNASAFTNGADAEKDAPSRVRFAQYFASLSKATKGAVAFAISSVQQGLNFTQTPNYNYAGTYTPGYFYVVVDDGTGHPSMNLISLVSSAIDAVRGLTISFGVFAPIITTANVAMVLTSAAGYDHPTIIASVSTAIQNFINGMIVGQSLPYTQLASIAYSIPGVTNVSSILLNSGTSDLAADNQHRILPGSMTIS